MFFVTLGRQPHKRLPTDELFSEELLQRVQYAFDNSLPDNVHQESKNPEYSCVMELISGTLFTYEQYKATKYRSM